MHTRWCFSKNSLCSISSVIFSVCSFSTTLTATDFKRLLIFFRCSLISNNVVLICVWTQSDLEVDQAVFSVLNLLCVRERNGNRAGIDAYVLFFFSCTTYSYLDARCAYIGIVLCVENMENSSTDNMDDTWKVIH